MREPTSRVRWFVVFWLFVLSAVAYLERANLSIAGTKLVEEFAISNIQLGFFFSAFLLGYALFQTPAGWLADRFGPRRVLTVGVVWWGVFSALTASISHRIANVVIVLLVLRFLFGAGEAIIYPASNQFVARGFRVLSAARPTDLSSPGSALTPASHLPSSLSSCCTTAGAPRSWIASRDMPRYDPSVSSDELAFIHKGIVNAAAPGSTDLLSWSMILSNRNVWILSFAYFCFC